MLGVFRVKVNSIILDINRMPGVVPGISCLLSKGTMFCVFQSGVERSIIDLSNSIDCFGKSKIVHWSVLE